MPRYLDEARQRWAGAVAAIGLAVVAVAAVFVVADEPRQRISHSLGTGAATAVTGVTLVCGAVLATLIRLMARRPASWWRWLGRAAAGTLLLTPAVYLATRPFTPPGWDVDTCGPLLHQYRPTGTELDGFGSACAGAVDGRLWSTVAWTAAGCVVAIVWGGLARQTPPVARSSIRLIAPDGPS